MAFKFKNFTSKIKANLNLIYNNNYYLKIKILLRVILKVHQNYYIFLQ
jgi:hypothetical protein